MGLGQRQAGQLPLHSGPGLGPGRCGGLVAGQALLVGADERAALAVERLLEGLSPLGDPSQEGTAPARLLRVKKKKGAAYAVSVCLLWAMPLAVSSSCSSPAWNISRTMSQPPMNSPLT